MFCFFPLSIKDEQEDEIRRLSFQLLKHNDAFRLGGSSANSH